jgi:hypothetical protein
MDKPVWSGKSGEESGMFFDEPEDAFTEEGVGPGERFAGKLAAPPWWKTSRIKPAASRKDLS